MTKKEAIFGGIIITVVLIVSGIVGTVYNLQCVGVAMPITGWVHRDWEAVFEVGMAWMLIALMEVVTWKEVKKESKNK